MMFLFQFLYTIFLIIQRPYNKVASNLIEVINEMFFIFLLSWLLYFNKESRWTYSTTQAIIWMFSAINIMILLITIIDILMLIIQRIKNRRKPTPNTSILSTENTQRQILQTQEIQIYTENNRQSNENEEEKKQDNEPKAIVFTAEKVKIAPML